MYRLRPSGGTWGLKKTTIGVFLVATISIFVALTGTRKYPLLSSSTNCHFPAIYNFGDSNSDTGSRSAVFNQVPSPYGITFFGKPSGRLSDGRLIIDFIAERMGLPYLNAYLDSIGTSFRHGANFASGGSTIQPVDGRMFEARFSHISLDVQLLQFQKFKASTNELYNQAKNSFIKSTLPRPEDFSNALYILDIGQNDLNAALRMVSEEQLHASIFNITNRFALAVEKLYEQGARAFWIQNTGPIGCLPIASIYNPPKADNVDRYGCVKSHNEVAQEFNRQLKEIVFRLSNQLSDAVLTYIDIYSAKYALISEAEKHGFVGNPLGFCCGRYGVQCGVKAMVDGNEVFGDSCSNPSAYISWDGMHHTDAANQWIANQFLNASYFYYPIMHKEKKCFDFTFPRG